MNPGILICFLLAHFIADFPLQFRKIIDLRNNKDRFKALGGNALHSGIHFVLMVLCSVQYWSIKIFLVILAVTAVHFAVDCMKAGLVLKSRLKRFSISIFLFDQLIHVLCILLFLYLARVPLPAEHLPELNVHMLKAVSLTFGQKVMLAFTLMIIGLWGVGVFIRLVLEKLNSAPRAQAIGFKLELMKTAGSPGTEDGGFIIGILERLFTMIAIVVNMPLMIGFILTVKSVARLKKFEDERFVEVFIIGSFISFISAIVAGYIIRLLEIIPY